MMRSDTEQVAAMRRQAVALSIELWELAYEHRQDFPEAVATAGKRLIETCRMLQEQLDEQDQIVDELLASFPKTLGK